LILCVVCKEAESMVQRGPGAPLCRACRAEITLTADDPKLALQALDVLFQAESGKVTLNATVEDVARKSMARAVMCERCGRPELYNPSEKKTSFFCDSCGKQLCRECAASCSHKDFDGTKILCTDCRAEKSLTGQPVEETIKDLPGMEKKREPLPHCGRPSCVGEANDPDPWCGCECAKCKTAVGAGFPAPMFGKQAPDPDPVLEPAPAATDDEIASEEEEIARTEGGQQ
jgi:hypothetical protein